MELFRVMWHLGALSLRENLYFNLQKVWFLRFPGAQVKLIIFTEFPELVDAFFVVANKKLLIFLH